MQTLFTNAKALAVDNDTEVWASLNSGMISGVVDMDFALHDALWQRLREEGSEKRYDEHIEAAA